MNWPATASASARSRASQPIHRPVITSATTMKPACALTSGTGGIDGCDGRQEQHGHADSEADAHHRGRLGLAHAWQQHDRGANARHDQHETECPRRQRGKQRGYIISHEPPMTIRRSSSVWV